MALKVNEIVKVEVEASDGQVLREGDAIMLRVADQIRVLIADNFPRLPQGNDPIKISHRVEIFSE